MVRKPRLPKTLIDAVRYFADEDLALEFAAKVRWPEGEQTCPKEGLNNPILGGTRSVAVRRSGYEGLSER